MSHVRGLGMWKHEARQLWGARRATQRPGRGIKSSISLIWNERIKDYFIYLYNTEPNNCKSSCHLLS